MVFDWKKTLPGMERPDELMGQEAEHIAPAWRP
jgi:hypothetical protein